MSAGRSRFTLEARAALLARLELGVPFEDAATAAGVRPNTAKSWLARGRREPGTDYALFAAAVEAAREAATRRPVPMGEDEPRRPRPPAAVGRKRARAVLSLHDGLGLARSNQ